MTGDGMIDGGLRTCAQLRTWAGHSGNERGEGAVAATVTNEKELGKALKDDEDTIVITGKLGAAVITIKAKGRVAWLVAAGAIGVAAAAVLSAPFTGGVSGIAGIAAAPAAVGILGGAATTSAIAIAVAAGGVSALGKLRKYRVAEKTEGRVVLRRK